MPLGERPRLEADEPAALLKAQLLGEQARRFLAVAVVRIARVEVALRDAMERHEETFGLAVLPDLAHAVRERGDVAGCVVVAVDRAHLGHPAAPGQGPRDVLEYGSRRGSGVLRIQGENDDAAGIPAVKFVERCRDRRVSVRHAQRNVHFAGKSLRQLLLDAGRNVP